MANMDWTNQGGYLTSDYLNKKVQVTAQPLARFRQFVKFKDEGFNKHKGATVNWLKVSNVGTFGGTLTETNTMHESDQTLTWGTLTVNEYGNSIPLTRKIEELSEFEIMDIVKNGLMDDMVKCLDGEVERQFNATKLRYVGTATGGGAVTTNGTAAATNTSIFNTYHTRKMLLQLKTRNVPGFNKLGGDYVCIASHEAMEGVFSSIESIAQYTSYDKIAAGEVARYFGVRFVEDGFATRFTYDSAARTATAKSWTGGNSLDAYLFGGPTVREAVAVKEQIRAKEVSDYGRSKGLAWYFLGGWKIEWDTAADSRIIKWDSA